ncbi:malonyl-coenzyme:anthocyanin 5-O-glucoside-6'''-O-malonyltransferase-like [Andrographis paniculata]|uniref:malonyl-coenzyme:anthocyanin 5-O-glucoside-6'''-O-malonyltransferase-like n=1 Tax=Andrographis paniculata TaxID=175694 RepID=UPI0021E8F145|nr:malonyl-coenzyme:anthocyanin 5-O-glucoside-6'''-O-malonyltransferase-like [Andrographis paniculata]
MPTKVLETCRISPPAGGEISVPLSFFDLPWIHFHPIRRLLFYEYPPPPACSDSDSLFFETIVPQLKRSLSLTLARYLPVAGNLVYPDPDPDPDPDVKVKKPIIRYVAGDSVSLTVAESTCDFDELVGNCARDADQFYDFVPQLPPPVADDGSSCNCKAKAVPVMALKVTLFPPGRGICFGFVNNHCLGDASSIVGFIQAWADTTKLLLLISAGNSSSLSLRGEEKLLALAAAEDGDRDIIDSSLPLPPVIFDRSVISDPLGIDDIFWEVLKKVPLKSSTFPVPTNRVRATFTLHPADIEKLKNVVSGKKPGLVVSSFVVTASYVWRCLVKSGEEAEADDDDEYEYFIFAVDIRGRINPPVPANYFGNCLSYGMAKIEHRELVGEEGFVIAAEAVAKDIKNRVNNKEEVLKGAENWMSDMKKYQGIRVLGVSGSPKFDLPGVDFGWGRARKLEVLSIDGEEYSMSLCRSGRGLEIGLSLPRPRMEAFAALFTQGID